MNIVIVLLLAAFVLFVVSTFRKSASFDLLSAGLACVVLSMLAPVLEPLFT